MKKPTTYNPKKKTKGFTPTKTFNGRGFMDRLYSQTWSDFSKEFLRANKKCYACGNYSECVDHIEPHLGRLNVFWKDDNYLPLCHRCHNTITARFDRYHWIDKSLEKKLTWIAAERAKKGITSRVRLIHLPADAVKLLSPVF